MAKFKIGDKVKVVKGNSGMSSKEIGSVGTIVGKLKEGERGCINNELYDYLVDFSEQKEFTLWGDRKSCRFYNERNLEAVEETPAQNWKLVVIPHGDVTKGVYYHNGKVEKTVEVKRYFKDEYSEEAAVEAIVNKIFEKSPEAKPDNENTKSNFPWKRFIDGDVLVRFDSRKTFKSFLKECEKRGMKWNNGERPTGYGVESWQKNVIIGHNVFKIKNHSPSPSWFRIDRLSMGVCEKNYDVIEGRKVPVIDYEKVK